MAFDKFLIAPLKSGLMTNTKSWQIMDDAFELCQNAYTFRGRLRKRFGSNLMGTSPLTSRLRMSIGTTDGSGNLEYVTLPGNFLSAGALFSVGVIQFVVTSVPTVAGNTVTLVSTDQGPGGLAVGVIKLLSTPPNVYQFEITGGQTTVAGLPVYWYPSNPVMGITQYENGAINNLPSYAFDTQFAYIWLSGAWERSGSTTNPLWHGTNFNYFWVCNWQGIVNTGVPAMFVSNFNFTLGTNKPAATDDPIWYTQNGSTWVPMPGSASSGIFFLPGGGAVADGPFVQTALIIVAFKYRLLLLNTVENNNSVGAGVGTASQFKQRCRYTWNGNPFAVNAWYEPNQQDASGNLAAGGGYIDATTQEAIVSAEFIKDRLIVYFERSTWELVYTQNENLPFLWQKLNTELGSQSTHGTVPFDRDVLTIGNTGVHACNGSNVRRIDDKIPDVIFEFKTENNETARIAGIRDYYSELVYWTYVADTEQPTQIFPNQVLVFNYQNETWAQNDDCITAFGYFEQQTDVTWKSSAPETWETYNGTWISGVIQANQRQILAGTPEGFILRLDVEASRNAPSMQISAIDYTYSTSGILTLTIYNHNLDSEATYLPQDNDYILIENVIGDAATEAALNGVIFPATTPFTQNSITIVVPYGFTGTTYLGSGTAARVSNIQIESKNFNPYIDKDQNVYVARADFAVQKTAGGQITVDYRTGYSPIPMLQAGEGTNSIMGNGILETSPYDPTLYPFETYQDLLWHPIYFQSTGEFIQFVFYFSQAQITNPSISLADFELQAICLYTTVAGRLQ
ncbi:unnamed protein product [Sphagnum balticum]